MKKDAAASAGYPLECNLLHQEIMEGQRTLLDSSKAVLVKQVALTSL